MTFSKLHTRFWGISFLMIIPFISFSANIAIIESQSNHPMQVMDLNWNTVVSNMGHTSSILPQSTLDDLTNLDGYDLLILSSGLIDLSMNRRATLKAFFNSGRSMYLQSEYLLSHPGNMVFDEIIAENGNTFTWEGESTGSITPMNTLGDLGSSPNEVTSLSYFWYGTYGNGDNSIIPFLESNDKYYGFTYCPSNPVLGRLVTTSDQDWVRIFSSENLMQNIIYTLTEITTITTPPLISIDFSEVPDCENGTYSFVSEVVNDNGSLNYQWQVNGMAIPSANSSTFLTNDLSEGDVVECEILMEVGCKSLTHLSNPILIAPIEPLSEVTLNINSTQNSNCAGEEINFTASLESEGSYTVIAYQWQVNNFDVFGANEATFITNNLNNNDVVICNVQYTDVCNSLNLISSNELTTAINAMVMPTINITPNNTTACEGEEVIFTTEGSYWGSQPSFQWQINGANVGNNSNTFSTSSLVAGAQVTCILTSSDDCIASSEVVSTPVMIDITSPLIPSIMVSADQEHTCENEAVTFTAEGANWGSNPIFFWKVNGQPAGTNDPVFISNTLSNNAEVTCTIQLNDFCVSANELTAIPVIMSTESPVTPQVTISSNVDAACIGSEIIFNAITQNAGANPSFEWLIDNNPTGNNSPTFTTTGLSNGQIVSCLLISDESCVTSSEVLSNEVGVNISDITLIVNHQGNDYCGLGNGRIQVGTNYAIGNVSYNWSNGSTTSVVKDLLAGTYSVTATDALGCTSTLSVAIEETDGLEISSLNVQDADCGESNGAAFITMADNTKTYYFTWMKENGNVLSTESLIRDLPAGKYLLEITDETDCYLLEEVVINGSDAITIEMEDRMNSNWGDMVKLQPKITGTGNLTFNWSPATGLSCTDCPNPTFTAETETTYTLEVYNEAGCSETKSIFVSVKKSHDVYIPNAFSPNGDGNNDFFTAFGGDKVKIIKSIQVVDRWGSVLFSKKDINANDETAGWDGTSKGQRLNVGIYLYSMEVEFIDGRVRLLSGDVTLAR